MLARRARPMSSRARWYAEPAPRYRGRPLGKEGHDGTASRRLRLAGFDRRLEVRPRCAGEPDARARARRRGLGRVHAVHGCGRSRELDARASRGGVDPRGLGADRRGGARAGWGGRAPGGGGGGWIPEGSVRIDVAGGGTLELTEGDLFSLPPGVATTWHLTT